MPKGAVRTPSVHKTIEEATAKAIEVKERAFTLKKGPNSWHVVAPNASTAILDLARHQGLETVYATPGKPRPVVKRLKQTVSKLTPEEKAEMRRLLDETDTTPAVAEPQSSLAA